MRYLVIPLAIVGVVLALMLGPSIQEKWEDQNAYARQEQQLQLQRQQTALQDWQAQQQATAASRALIGNMGYLGAGLAGVLALMFVVDYYRQRRIPLQRYDARRPLVARQLIEQADPNLIAAMLRQLELSGQAAIQAAIHQPGQTPANLHQHISSPAQLPYIARPELPSAVAEHPAVVVPSFGDLLDQGAIGVDADGRNQLLILGYDESSNPIQGDWKSLYSCGLGGVQGSGKSSTAAYLLAQSALCGGRILVCDPHQGDDESLANRIAALAPAYLADVASDDAAILAALQLANDELDRRMNGSKDRWPLVIVVDEWTSLLRHELRTKLPAYVADFASQGRKYGINCMLLGQGWTVDAAGGADVRNRLTAHYVHRTRKEEARYQLGTGSLTPADTITLAPGQAYLLTTAGQMQKVVIPKVTTADMLRVGAMLSNSPKGENRVSDDRPFGFQMKAKSTQVETHLKPGFESRETRPESATGLAPEVARIISLFTQGLSIGEIVKAMHGEISGPKYNQARAEVERAIRLALAQRAA